MLADRSGSGTSLHIKVPTYWFYSFLYFYPRVFSKTDTDHIITYLFSTRYTRWPHPGLWLADIRILWWYVQKHLTLILMKLHTGIRQHEYMYMTTSQLSRSKIQDGHRSLWLADTNCFICSGFVLFLLIGYPVLGIGGYGDFI